MEVKGRIHSIETFGSVDGPGIRFVLFMQGCPMRCQYCHNPDTWCVNSGREVSADEILNEAIKYEAYWGKKGGITVSGGEALMQIDFIIELFKKAKDRGINTCLDTSGVTFSRENKKFDELIKYCDLFLLDIKTTNNELHKVLTGHENKNIIDFARYLNENNIPVWIRHVLVPTITDKKEDLLDLKALLATLANVEKVEILPYHTLGVFKYEELGIDYPLKGIEMASKEDVDRAKEILGL